MRDVVGDFLQTPHQRFDALEHGIEVIGKPVEFIAGAGDRQSAGKIARHDHLRLLGHGVDAAEDAPADEEAAGETEHDDQRQRPLPGIGNDAEQPLALLEIAADQKTEAAGQLHYLYQRAVLVALRRFEPAIVGFEPTGMIEHARLKRADVTGEALPGRRRDQIEARTRSPRTQVDDDDQPPDAALSILLAQAADLGIDRCRDLLGDQAARIERKVAQQRCRKHNENQQIDERQPESRCAKQFTERSHRSLSFSSCSSSCADLALREIVFPEFE